MNKTFIILLVGIVMSGVGWVLYNRFKPKSVSALDPITEDELNTSPFDSSGEEQKPSSGDINSYLDEIANEIKESQSVNIGEQVAPALNEPVKLDPKDDYGRPTERGTYTTTRTGGTVTKSDSNESRDYAGTATYGQYEIHLTPDYIEKVGGNFPWKYDAGTVLYDAMVLVYNAKEDGVAINETEARKACETWTRWAQGTGFYADYGARSEEAISKTGQPDYVRKLINLAELYSPKTFGGY